MSFQLITEEYCLKLCAIIDGTRLDQKIEIENKGLDLKFVADHLSDSNYNPKSGINYGVETMERHFFLGSEKKVIQTKNKGYDLFFNLGSWGYDVRIENSHLVLGSKLFKSDYFNQIELSQSLEDKDAIYIVKNLSRLAGKGSLMRLNKGAKSKEEKCARRDLLVEKLNAKVIRFEKHDWLCIDSIKKQFLNKKTNHPEVLFNFLEKYLEYAFAIEEIAVIENK